MLTPVLLSGGVGLAHRAGLMLFPGPVVMAILGVAVGVFAVLFLSKRFADIVLT